MKSYKLLLTAALGCVMAFGSCSEEDGGGTTNGKIPQNVIDAFNEQYPNAKDVAWSNNGEYAIAKFSTDTKAEQSAYNNCAWFRLSDAFWGMTETEIPFSQLPSAVVEAFYATEYSQAPWVRDDEVDMLKRNTVETLYVIEVEKKEGATETEADLYFTEDGIMTKVIFDDEKDKDYHEWLPQVPAASISEWLAQHYPNARLIEIDREDNGTEVELIYNGWKLEILFNGAAEWVYTKTDYERKIEYIETEVLNTLRSHSYYTNDRAIEDAERYETAKAGTFYEFELETRFDDDVKVYIALDGTLLEKRPELGDNTDGYPVNEEIRNFIQQRYPGAYIVECDYDKGYLEVEIRHEGFEKELKFNGRYEWLSTKWEIESRHLPEIIFAALDKAGYDTREIDDIDVYDTPAGVFYYIEIETGGRDVKVVTDTEGHIVKVIEEHDD